MVLLWSYLQVYSVAYAYRVFSVKNASGTAADSIKTVFPKKNEAPPYRKKPYIRQTFPLSQVEPERCNAPQIKNGHEPYRDSGSHSDNNGRLGMRDTMDDFLKTYYDDATNYSSRIYIAEEQPLMKETSWQKNMTVTGVHL